MKYEETYRALDRIARLFEPALTPQKIREIGDEIDAAIEAVIENERLNRDDWSC